MMFSHPHDDPILTLDDAQSWELLKRAAHGRVVLSVRDRIDIFPVNYGVQNGTLVFRTAPGTKLAEVAVNERVLFEVDRIHPDEGWSVVVRGTATRLERGVDIAEAEELHLRPWVPTIKDFYVRIAPDEVAGRHFRFGPHPEREI